MVEIRGFNTFPKGINLKVNVSVTGLVGFYGISSIIGYLMPNPFYTYILNIGFLNTFCC